MSDETVKKITYEDKENLNNESLVPGKNKIDAADMNQIKEAVNNNADLFTALKELVDNGDLNGSSILYGTGIPDNELGKDGDVYINLSEDGEYARYLFTKESNEWLPQFSIQGGSVSAVADTLPIGSQVMWDGDTPIPTGWSETEAPFYRPNLVVNGDFKCWQRGTSFTDDYGYAVIYTADMWWISFAGGKTCSAVKVDNGIKIYGQTDSRLSQYIPYEYDDLGVASFSFVIDGKLSIYENVSVSEEAVELENNDKRQIALKYDPDKKAILLQFTLKDNQEHIFTYVRCDRGKIAYPHIPEDLGTALARCQQYIKKYIANGNVIYHYPTDKRYLIDVPLDEMAGTPTLSNIVVKWYGDNGMWITGNVIEALQVNRLVTFYVSYDGLLPIHQYSLTTECIFTASCEP